MAANTLNILKPSVNNLTVRIFVRAAGLEFEELDVWGKKSDPGVPREGYPADLTPMLEEEGLPKGALWESCAIMAYLCNKHGLDAVLSHRSRRAGDGRQRDVLPDRHALSASSRGPRTRRSASRSTRARSGTSEADDEMKAKAQQDAEAALAEPLEAYNTFFLDGRQFVGGDTPSIADIRCAATLEFLRAIDYDLPAWAEEYMARMEETLGDAYSEPAADVRGYIDYVRSQSA